MGWKVVRIWGCEVRESPAECARRVSAVFEEGNALPCRAVSLFSGCGGADLGLRAAGFDVVFANDVWATACTLYRANLADVDVASCDVRSIESSQAGISWWDATRAKASARGAPVTRPRPSTICTGSSTGR